MLSANIELGPSVSETAVYGTPTYPEMSLQFRNTTQSMRGQMTGHVTTKVLRQPLGDERAKQPDHTEEGSHLSQGGQP